MKKALSLILILCLAMSLLAACAAEPEAPEITPTSAPVENTPTPSEEVEETPEPSAEPAPVVRIGGMTGPTSMGMVKLMEDDANGESLNDYEFTLKSEASAFVSDIATGKLDIAALPANLASVIYHNTEGGVKMLAINTLGVLYIVERGETVTSFADLAGRTLYATGEGAVPEFNLRYLLAKNGITEENGPNIQWCADTTEALSYIAADENAVAMLPQPFLTVAQTKVENLRMAIDLNAEWEKLEDASAMVTGVVVVRTEFAEQYPEVVDAFLKEYEASVEFVLADNAAAAELIGKFEIFAAPVALKALPSCNICFTSGEEMKIAMEGYLTAISSLKPGAIGGSLPADDFYYAAG